MAYSTIEIQFVPTVQVHIMERRVQAPTQFERRAAPHTSTAQCRQMHFLEELRFVPMMLVAAGVELQQTRVVCLAVVACFSPSPVGFRRQT